MRQILSSIICKAAVMLAVVIVAVAMPRESRAQFSPKIDSLIALAEHAPDSIAAARNNDVCWKLRNVNPEIAIKFGMKAIDIAKSTNDFEQLVKGYAFTGVCQRNLDNFEDALEYYRLGIEYALKYDIKDQLGYGYINLGNLLIHEGKFEEAQGELEKALPIGLEIKDSAVLGYVYLNLGRTRLAAKDFDKAEEYFLQSLDIRTKCKRLNSQRNVSRKYLADCHADAGLVGLAHKEYMTTLANADIIGDYDLLSELTYNIAQQHFREKHYDSTLVYAALSLGYAKHLGSKKAIMLAYSIMADVYRAKGDYKGLAENNKSQIECNDSLFRGKVNLQIFNIKYSFDSHKKQMELERLTEQQFVQKHVRIASCIILSLIVGALTFITIKNRKVKKLNSELAEQKNSLASANNEITASINYARRLQHAALNTDESVAQIFPESMVYYRPKEIVSGDWYRVEERGGYRIVIEADCNGLGVPGSLLSMMGISIFKDIINAMAISGEKIRASIVLDRMRENVKTLLAKESTEEFSIKGMDASIAVVDSSATTMSFAAACQMALLVRGGVVMQLKGDAIPVGSFLVDKPFTEQVIPIQENDSIFFMNSGVRNLENPSGEKYFDKRFTDFLVESSNMPMSVVRDRLVEEIASWRGDMPQSDDMTLVGFRIC